MPFVSFIVLAGNAIATTSNDDLELLTSALSVLAPVTDISPTIQKMHDACDKFSRIAGLIVSNANQGSLDHKQQGGSSNNSLPPHLSIGEPDLLGQTDPTNIDYSFPMAQEDWDSVMMGFESELGDYDSRTLANIIEPYIANPGW